MAEPKAELTDAHAPTLKQLTPVLIVDAVEPCIKFWTDRLGFEVKNGVGDNEGKLISASVKRGGMEKMYQPGAGVPSGPPGAGGDLTAHSGPLFTPAADLDSVEKSLGGAPIVNPRHDTFYGST